MLTAKGIKPICPFQQVFQSTYLYGAFSPFDGNSFMLNLPYCDANCFQIFLNEMSYENPQELKVIVLDNGAFHHAKKLIIPQNLVLILLPPYSPELNPAEKIWQNLKRSFTNKIFKTLEEVEDFINKKSTELERSTIKSICAYEYVFFNNDWSLI